MTNDDHDDPDPPWPGFEPCPELSNKLLERARVGWERFVDSMGELSDE
ncbi:hypothetical protein ABT403_06050 [Streptomyces sp. NPDC000075]